MFKRGLVWWISFVHDGRGYRQSTGTASKRLAQQIENKVKAEVVHGKWFERLPGGEETFEEMMQKYLVSRIVNSLKKVTLSF